MYGKKIFRKKYFTFLPFLLSIKEKMSEKFDTSFLIKYFRNVSMMLTSVKKNKKFHIFFEKSNF
jgi:hypothetical protein